MSETFDLANDKFTRGIIRRKALQIVQRPGFSQQDLESLEQTMLTKVIKAMASFDPQIAHRNVFITTVVERFAGTLLKQGATLNGGSSRVQSLNAMVFVAGDFPTELQNTLDEAVGGARLQVERNQHANYLIWSRTLRLSFRSCRNRCSAWWNCESRTR